ncbi:MAG: C45 family peptidase [Gudongella sp.]|nr:C45 family peptidase [Gudongella sp.]
MIPFKISIEQYRGTSYDIGYQQGLKVENSLINKFSNIVSEEIDVDELIKLYSLHAPHLLAELAGLADSKNITIKEAAVFTGYGVPKIQGMGCSSVLNYKMLVRNYDFSPQMYDARFILIQPKEGYASVGHSLHVMGRTEGANEKGLAVALHFVNNEQIHNGFSAGGIIRIILDTCKNTDEAINKIKQLPHSWSYNFSIGDTEGHTVIVEKSPTKIKIRNKDDMLFCTNHFQDEEMLKLNRETLEETQGRLNYLLSSDLNNMNGREVFNVFREKNTPLYNEKYEEYFGTLHTFAYLFDENKVLTAIPGGEAIEIDFESWVKGENFRQNELKGYLNCHDFEK